MEDQAASTMTLYLTQSHYPEWTSSCPILIMSSDWLGSDNYQFVCHWFDLTRVPTCKVRFPHSPKIRDGRSAHSAILSSRSTACFYLVMTQSVWCVVVEKTMYDKTGHWALSHEIQTQWWNPMANKVRVNWQLKCQRISPTHLTYQLCFLLIHWKSLFNTPT